MSVEWSRRYGELVIFGPFRPVEPEELRAVEAEIGAPLPEDYRAFIEQANGGSLQYAVRVPPEDESIGFTDLHLVGRDERGGYGADTLIGAYRGLRDWRLPGNTSTDRLLPIAGDGGGDTLFLDLEGDGRLVAFVHGLPEWTGRSGEDALVPVSESFDAYLRALVLDDDIAEVTWADVKDEPPADEWRRTVETWLDAGLPDWRDRPWATA